MTFKLNKIYNLDCIAGMTMIPYESVDMILCDLPYGITGCRWDSIIPFDMLWEQYKRIIKPRGAIVLTASQPFTTALINSNPKMFKYCWYWIKNQVTGFPFANFQPLRCVEDICVFYKQTPKYNPQGLKFLTKPCLKKRKNSGEVYRGSDGLLKPYIPKYTNYPRQILNIKCQRDGLHPTQKPVELFEYLIKTYTDEGDIVLDNCIGSGTTAIACINTERKYIGFEIEEKYYNIAVERINKLKNRERS